MEDILKIIENFKGKKIMIIGDIMLDEYVMGSINRISQEAPVPILEVEKIAYFPGGGANTAYNIKALGDEVMLLGVVGRDREGEILLELLKTKGLANENIFIDAKRKTTLKKRIIAKGQQVIRLDFEDRIPICPDLENKILALFKKKIKQIDAVIISDYAKGVATDALVKNIISAARANKVLCLIDSKSSDYSKYKNCHLITPNEKELAQALDADIDDEKDLLAAGDLLFSSLNCDALLVKQGVKGMVLFEKGGKAFHFPAINQKAIDVSGAGDTSIAAFALSLASGANFKQAMVVASHACGVVVGKRGTAVVSPEELKESLKNNSNYHYSTL